MTSRFAVVAGALLLGPVTGPFLLGAVHCFRAKRYVSAALCLVAVAAFWLAAPALLAQELEMLRR